MNRRAFVIASLAFAGAAGTGFALRRSPDERGLAASGTVTIGSPTPVPTPEELQLCDNPTIRKALIRQRIANLRAEIAQYRAALDDCG